MRTAMTVTVTGPAQSTSSCLMDASLLASVACTVTTLTALRSTPGFARVGGPDLRFKLPATSQLLAAASAVPSKLAARFFVDGTLPPSWFCTALRVLVNNTKLVRSRCLTQSWRVFFTVDFLALPTNGCFVMVDQFVQAVFRGSLDSFDNLATFNNIFLVFREVPDLRNILFVLCLFPQPLGPCDLKLLVQSLLHLMVKLLLK
mmetsp:Transcript_5966/g.13570  ORF Transcript_5966/g.13570 Transcript_5966/m.13570 type:complete len:203 (+) Transcript_5966:588-1196(+)